MGFKYMKKQPDRISLEQFDGMVNKVLDHTLPENGFVEGCEKEYYRRHKDRIYKTLELALSILSNVHGKKVLDIGSSPGYIALALKSLGYDVVGGWGFGG